MNRIDLNDPKLTDQHRLIASIILFIAFIFLTVYFWMINIDEGERVLLEQGLISQASYDLKVQCGHLYRWVFPTLALLSLLFAVKSLKAVVNKCD